MNQNNSEISTDPLPLAILHVIRAAGYTVESRDEGRELSAISPDGHRHIARAEEPADAAARLAVMLGFDLEG